MTTNHQAVAFESALLPTTQNSSHLQGIFQNQIYTFQALRTLSYTPFKGADIRECFEVISKIEEENDESWYENWYLLAERLHKEALLMLKKGHFFSARDRLFRASNYYRTSEFFLRSSCEYDPIAHEAYRKSKATFRQALNYLPFKVELLSIPFEGISLPAYFISAQTKEEKRPLIILQTGFDGTAEELFLWASQACLERNYHCLIFEGPGQGSVIREYKLPFRYNWESVITPVLNYALAYEKNIDENRVALMGLSFGGYLVSRALVFENRIKLGIVNGGVYDFHQVALQGGPKKLSHWIHQAEAHSEINASILKRMQTSSLERWFFNHGMLTFQVKTPTELLLKTKLFELSDTIEKITAKMLVVDSEKDFLMKDQSKKFFNALRTSKTLMKFTSQEGADLHCQIGALSLSKEKIFNWIDENL